MSTAAHRHAHNLPGLFQAAPGFPISLREYCAVAGAGAR